VDVLVFLLRGVHFLLFLLLAALQVTSQVEVRVLADRIERGDAAALEYNSALRNVERLEK
jgi:hypothetical protein